MDADLTALIKEAHKAGAALRATVDEIGRVLHNRPLPPDNASNRSEDSPVLLMAEGLVSAHKAAVTDGDGATLDLIEDALRHVGERLSRECADGRIFRRRRLSA